MKDEMTTYNVTHCMYFLKTFNTAHQLLVTLKVSLNFHVIQTKHAQEHFGTLTIPNKHPNRTIIPSYWIIHKNH